MEMVAAFGLCHIVQFAGAVKYGSGGLNCQQHPVHTVGLIILIIIHAL